MIVQPPGLLKTATKTITFTGAANLGGVGNLPIFTTTGAVHIASIYGFVGTSLTGATATIALGVAANTSLFIGATTATTLTSTNAIWMSTTATAGGLAVPAAAKDIVVMQNIVGTVATTFISGGVLTITCYYLPVSAGAGLV